MIFSRLWLSMVLSTGTLHLERVSAVLWLYSAIAGCLKCVATHSFWELQECVRMFVCFDVHLTTAAIFTNFHFHSVFIWFPWFSASSPRSSLVFYPRTLDPHRMQHKGYAKVNILTYNSAFFRSAVIYCFPAIILTAIQDVSKGQAATHLGCGGYYSCLSHWPRASPAASRRSPSCARERRLAQRSVDLGCVLNVWEYQRIE